MPTLDFKGKQFVYAHHLSVPFRQLDIDAKKSVTAPKGKNGGEKPGLDDNLIIHGDNLHALKALLPKYAGKVKCIYIDPPYNTGNEGWCYNDAVNAPLMKEWLKKEGNPVDKEDLERHDKWLCMMWPRLQLLRELLADDGVIFVSIDDNENHHLKAVLDEVFGEHNFCSDIIWQKTFSAKNDAKYFSSDHEYIYLYAKNLVSFSLNLLDRTDKQNARYSNPDNDPRGVWSSTDLLRMEHRDNSVYTITSPISGMSWTPAPGTSWRHPEDEMKKMIDNNEITFGPEGKTKPRRKRFLSEVKQGMVPQTLWKFEEVGHTQEGKQLLKSILGDSKDFFATPKPPRLIKKILQIATDQDSIVLDSFAGSGTTAHAVLALNKEDGGNRKFILVECEDYADTITAERVRRVIKGVPGAKDDALKSGLGGSFTFCELGKEINIENLLKGGELPDYDELARYAFFTSTGQTLDKVKQGADYFVGETEQYRVHVIYKPDSAFLRSGDSALNAALAASISKSRGKKTALVFATHKFMGQKELTEMGVTYCQLPYAIHRVMGD